MYYKCLTGGILGPQERLQNPAWGTVGPSVGDLGRCLTAHMGFLGRHWHVLGDLGAIAVELGSSLVDLVSEQREARRLARRASKIRTCKRTQEMQALKGKR